MIAKGGCRAFFKFRLIVLDTLTSIKYKEKRLIAKTEFASGDSRLDGVHVAFPEVSVFAEVFGAAR